MAKYATLKAAIEEIITTNGNYEISGEDMRNTLKAIVDSLGADYQLVGFALPATDPGTPDQNVAYLAGPGTYPNFGPTTVEKGQIGLFKYNGTWSYETLDCGMYLEYEEYPGGDAYEWTFYDSDNPDGLTIKIAKTVSGLGNDPNVAISQWWAAQTERKINVLGGYTISIDSLTTTPQALGLFKAIQTGQIIDSITGANKLIFGTDGGGSVTVNASDLPYKATANLVNVRTESGTANNVSIVVRGINDILPAYININEIANHPGAYASAAAALSDVPALYRRKGVKVVYFDDDMQLWIEMVCQDDAGVNWWTDVTNNWNIEGPIETDITTPTGGKQLMIGGVKKGNLDDVLNVNVWNEQATEYATQDAARAAVPLNKRKLGAIITYLLADGWMKDQFVGSDISDWDDATKWIPTDDNAIITRGVLPSCDLDTVIKPGVWLLKDSNTYTHIPSGFSAGFLRVSVSGGGWLFQEFFELGGSYYAKRRKSQGGFSDWVRLDAKVNDDAINNNTVLGGLVPGRISNRIKLTASSTVSGKFIDTDGTEKTNASFSYQIFAIDASKLYAFNNQFSSSVGIGYIAWFDDSNNFISVAQPTGNTILGKQWVLQSVYPPKNAAYAYVNRQNSFNEPEFFEISMYDLATLALISKGDLPAGNLNDRKESGFYLLTGQSYQNVPGGNSYGFLRITIAGAGSTWGIQEYWNLTATEYYLRRWNGSNFTDWLKINDLSLAESLKNDVGEIMSDLQKHNILVNDSVHSGYYINADGEIQQISSSFAYRVFSVTPGDVLSCKVKVSPTVSFWLFNWFDEDGNYISHKELIPNSFDGTKTAIVPSNARYVYVNQSNDYPIVLSKLVGFIDISDSENIPDLINAVSDVFELTPDSTTDGKFIDDDGTEGTNANFSYKTFTVTGGKNYLFSGLFGNAGINYIHWFDENGNWIVGSDETGPNNSYVDKLIKAPSNAAYAKQNIQNSYLGYFKFKEIGQTILSRELKSQIENLSNRTGVTKLVIESFGEPVSSIWGNSIATDRFHIRAKYNAEKDILIRHYYNGNELVSFLDTFIGPNTLTDAQLATNDYLVSYHQDSTAPFFKVTEYWHLFAQHGYPIPHIDNPGMSSNDVGALWKDQLNREFYIGYVTTSKIYLLPKIYQSDGHDVRDWKNSVYSTAITSLIHVSGGVYTTTIPVSGYGQDQLRPIMTMTGRKFTVDGKTITEPGTYYGDEVSISESAVGLDPASISNENWFANTGGNVNPVGNPMAKFTFSYNYFGAQCCVNTTVQILKELQCEGYGAIQQQFFFDDGDYKAMFVIPKAAAQGNVELDKPFNSPSSGSQAYDFYRTAQYLKDVNNPVDRQIGYLYDPNTNKYRVGMAAGLSLVSGDTITSKRIINCIEGNNAANYRILSFSPSNTNKFYVMAINTAKYENGFFPVGLFKEINYYVSYFDPAENVGQVYWYKDGNKFIIYCHCQSIETTLPINVPEYMEGLTLSVIEKTTNAELLTDTIQNGKFFVNYNTNEANYIVLKAE